MTESVTYIRQIRKEFGYNQKQMAEKMGYSISLIGKIETGNKKPTVGFIKRLKELRPDLDVAKFF